MTVLKKMNQEELNIDNLITYIKKMTKELDPIIISNEILAEAQQSICNNKNPEQLNEIIIAIAMSKASMHPDYLILASRIIVTALHENTKTSFVDKMEDVFKNTNLITAEELQIIKENKKILEDTIDYSRDLDYDVFSLKMLENNGLAKINDQLIERPQDFLMRIAIGIHKNNIEEVITTYNYMSEGWFLHLPSHLSETKKGNPYAARSITLEGENISALFNQLNNCTQIAQSFGEIGVAIHKVPSKVFIPTLRLFNETVNYLNLEKGEIGRPFTMYLEPWHSHVFEFLALLKNPNDLNFHFSNLNLALCIPDLFMERVENNGDWTLMCPSECPGLSNTQGKEFESLYKRYEAEGRGNQTIKSQELWFKILEAQIEIGSYQLLFKDQNNTTLNQVQPNIIKAPEYLEHTFQSIPLEMQSNNNFVSISLPNFVKNNAFDFEQLYDVIYRTTFESITILEQNKNQNRGIQRFPFINIPIHFEIQELAESFLKLKIPFDSEEAREINKEIFETIQFATISASNELAKENGFKREEEFFRLEDLFPFDLRNISPNTRWNWEDLKKDVKEFGVYNPFTIVLSPHSKKLGTSEETTPISSYIKTNKWASDETMIVNQYLLKDLIQEGLWNKSILQKIIQNQGSIQNIPEIPESLKEIYKTAWEVPQRCIIDMVLDRESFGVQSELMEIFIENPDFNKLTSVYFYTWKKGLKTNISHLRTKISINSMQFSFNPDISFNILEINDA